VRPRRLLNLLGGLVGGLFAAMGLAVLAEHRNRTFVAPEDVEEHLHVAALASIPRLGRQELKSNGRR